MSSMPSFEDLEDDTQALPTIDQLVEEPGVSFNDDMSADPRWLELQKEPGLEDVTVDDVGLVTSLPGLVKGGAVLAGKGAAKLIPNLPKYAGKIATNAAIRQTEGALARNLKGLGRDKLDAIADWMYKHGAMKPTTGSIGTEDLVKEGLKRSGGESSAVRQVAGDLGAESNPSALASELRTQRGPHYTGGTGGSEKAGFEMGLADLEKMGEKASAQEMADTASNLNRKAAGLKQYQPEGGLTDVANEISRRNNALIQSKVTPSEFEGYQAANQEYSTLKPLEDMLERGDTRDITRRSSNPLAQMYHGAMDLAGNKVMGNVAHGMNQALTNPVAFPLASSISPLAHVTQYLEDKYKRKP